MKLNDNEENMFGEKLGLSITLCSADWLIHIDCLPWMSSCLVSLRGGPRKKGVLALSTHSPRSSVLTVLNIVINFNSDNSNACWATLWQWSLSSPSEKDCCRICSPSIQASNSNLNKPSSRCELRLLQTRKGKRTIHIWYRINNARHCLFQPFTNSAHSLDKSRGSQRVLQNQIRCVLVDQSGNPN